MTTVPYGYQSARLSLAQLEGRATWNRLHPEFRRRCWSMFVTAQAEGVDIGIGTGWRSSATQAANYRQDRSRFAPPGKSWHEEAPHWAHAIDIVSSDGNRWAGRNSSAPGVANWDSGGRAQLERECRFGLRRIRSDESWHFQFAEGDKARPQNAAFPAHVLLDWDLPNLDDTPPPPPPPPPPAFVCPFPDGTYREGSTGEAVRVIQAQISWWGVVLYNGNVLEQDGRYGAATALTVAAWQLELMKRGIEVPGGADGVFGPRTKHASCYLLEQISRL